MFKLGFFFFHFNFSDLSKLGAGIDLLKATGMSERRMKQVDGITLGIVGQHMPLKFV
jgi:hypothetical protein